MVWFTEFLGESHIVSYGENLEKQARARTTKLSRAREDEASKLKNIPRQTTINRDVWRHEAQVTGLTPDVRLPYTVISRREDGQTVSSGVFSLACNPPPDTPVKILLTSDHQLKPMVAANLQKVVETVGRVDGVWFAGDLVNVSDRASEWFDDTRGISFFPGLQGRIMIFRQFTRGVKSSNMHLCLLPLVIMKSWA